jgi:hypothetical protein
MRRGSHHTPETRALQRARNLQFWTPAERAAQAAKTRQRMASPMVRARIVEGMLRSKSRGLDK